MFQRLLIAIVLIALASQAKGQTEHVEVIEDDSQALGGEEPVTGTAGSEATEETMKPKPQNGRFICDSSYRDALYSLTRGFIYKNHIYLISPQLAFRIKFFEIRDTSDQRNYATKAQLVITMPEVRVQEEKPRGPEKVFGYVSVLGSGGKMETVEGMPLYSEAVTLRCFDLLIDSFDP